MTNLTQEQVSELSDKELDLSIARKLMRLGLDKDITFSDFRTVDKKYCNNWNDLIPLMIERDIRYQLSEQATAREMAELLFLNLAEG